MSTAGRTQSARIHVLVVASDLTFSVTNSQRLSPVILWYRIRIGAPIKQPAIPEVYGWPPPGLSFLTGGTGGSGETTLCGVELAGGVGNVVNVQPLLLPF